MERTQEWREATDGTLELVDLTTGQVLERQKRNPKSLPSSKTIAAGGRGRGRPRKDEHATHVWVQNANGELFWVPKGTNPENLPARVPAIPYNQVTADLICEQIIEGKTLLDISKIPGFPTYPVIFTWAKKHPEFKAALEEAEKFSARFYRDKAIQTADTVQDERDVARARLVVDVSKWAAKVADADKFGDKVKHSGDPDQPIGFIIGTGIQRDEEEKPIEVKAEAKPALPAAQASGGAKK